ncbi:MAG: hypothetical protein KIT57_09205 [Blastocatellales bacterium]|nr:hypothetical protein [Blastocatellales bacterium]
MMSELPIVCTLSRQELRARQEGAIRELISSAEEITEIKDGYRFRFRPVSGLMPRLAEFVEQERRCCPFLGFALTVEPDAGPIQLTLTGPEGTGEFLREAFRLSSDSGVV